METQELLRRVREVEIKTRRKTNQLISGQYHSAFKGRGMLFAEVREYQMGDDVRTIDWNVTARMDTPYVKVFEEERELTFMLMVDISGSSFFGTRRQLKSQLITELCAVLAFSAIQNNDKVGLLFFSDGPGTYIPPRKGRSHGLRLIRELLQVTPQQRRTQLDQALQFYTKLVKKRSIVFVLSDFISDDYLKPLRIAARRHDVVGLRIYDPAEVRLPNVGWLPIKDAETGAISWRNTARKKVRQRLETQHAHYQSMFQESFRRAGADLLEIGTHEDYAKRLHEFFRMRERMG